MAQWTLLLMANPKETAGGSTGLQRELTVATGRTMTFSADEPDNLSFSMPGNHEQTARITPLVSDILVFRDDEVVQRYRVVSRALSKDGGTLKANFTALSYKALLKAWIFHDTGDEGIEHRAWPDTMTSTERKISEIMWAILSEGQDKANADLKISKFAIAPGGDNTLDELFGPDDTDFFLPGSSRLEALDTMAGMAPGFRWDIVPHPSNPYTELQMTLVDLGGGGLSTMMLDDGGAVLSWEHNLAGAEYGNVMRYGLGEFASYYPSEAGPATLPEGRWERPVDASPPEAMIDQIEADEYTERYAPEAYRKIHDAAPEISCTLRRGRWQGKDHLWVGMQARFLVTESVKAGKTTEDEEYILFIDEEIEVTEVSINVDDVGAEDVSLSLGRPKFRASTDLSNIDRRVSNLERRF